MVKPEIWKMFKKAEKDSKKREIWEMYKKAKKAHRKHEKKMMRLSHSVTTKKNGRLLALNWVENRLQLLYMGSSKNV